jgi:hypothetical protein
MGRLARSATFAAQMAAHVRDSRSLPEQSDRNCIQIMEFARALYHHVSELILVFGASTSGRLCGSGSRADGP